MVKLDNYKYYSFILYVHSYINVSFKLNFKIILIINFIFNSLLFNYDLDFNINNFIIK